MWPFQRNPRPAADAQATLVAASAGLEYPSERDSPFDVFRWPATSGTAARAVATHSTANAAIETNSLDEFFAGLSGDPRFGRLRDAARSTLRDPIVVRATLKNDAEVQVYLIGRASTGEWLGVHTVSVET